MKRLLRRQGILGGVCEGLSNYFDIDESLVRIIFVVAFFTPFPILLLYLLMWILIPSE